MSRGEWDDETQKQFEEMQNKSREFSEAIGKFRKDVTINNESMYDIDTSVSKFEHEVDMMTEAFRKMKHNCF